METNTKRRRAPAVKAVPPVEPVKPAPAPEPAKARAAAPKPPKPATLKPKAAAAPAPAPAAAKPKTRTRKPKESLAVKAHAADLRSPREIAIDICEKILTEGDNWNDDLYGERRPILMLTRHREHISPTSHERRSVAPFSVPKPMTSSVLRHVEELPHTDAGLIDFDEIKRMASESKPFDASNNSMKRRMTIIAAAIVGLIVLGTISTKITTSSGPPAFIRDIISEAGKTNAAMAGSKQVQAPGQP